MRLTGTELTEQRIELDGHEYIGCEFVRCDIEYAGGELHTVGCQFDACEFHFTGAAARTLRFMQQIYASGGIEMVERTFDSIRAPAGPVDEL